jgi:perosamine synthetase
MTDRIPVAAPALVGNESEYVLDCVESTWISSKGEYIDRFEGMFADFCGTKHAISCSNGTVALHLALEAVGVGPSDEVIVPDLTFVSTANAVEYCGGTPVFADVEPDTWTMDPQHVKDLATDNTAAIIPVHLYGHPVEMDPIKDVAQEYDAAIVEDAAEAHGATYRGDRVGSIGDVGTFSFYGNKIVTTGEGGMLVTDNDEVAERLRQLKDLSMDSEDRYWFEEVGFNYRMTNLQAAIGCAQMEKIDWHVNRRREISQLYDKKLSGVENIERPVEREHVKHAFWMYSILLDDKLDRKSIRDSLDDRGIGTRPFFYPMTSLPMYTQNTDKTDPEISQDLAPRGLNLPTWAGLDEEDIDRVVNALRNVIT